MKEQTKQEENVIKPHSGKTQKWNNFARIIIIELYKANKTKPNWLPEIADGYVTDVFFGVMNFGCCQMVPHSTL